MQLVFKKFKNELINLRYFNNLADLLSFLERQKLIIKKPEQKFIQLERI
jgi:hypothetical protein